MRQNVLECVGVLLCAGCSPECPDVAKPVLVQLDLPPTIGVAPDAGAAPTALHEAGRPPAGAASTVLAPAASAPDEDAELISLRGWIVGCSQQRDRVTKLAASCRVVVSPPEEEKGNHHVRR